MSRGVRAGARELDGVVVVDKPVGPTSFEVVRRVKHALGAGTAGHTGTLDPLASGVLVVCLGRVVKLQAWLAEGDKAYDAEVAFGAATTTEDAEGAVVGRGDASGLTAEAVRAALPAFTGSITQVPPMFSAVRVGGRRLHEAARAGEEVARAPRQVTVRDLSLTAFEPCGPGGLARARLRVRCSKGTYVRTLAADLGRALGLPAHLAALRRTAAGAFALADAVPLEELERAGPGAAAARVLPLGAAVRGWPLVTLSVPEERALLQGRPLTPPSAPEGLCAAFSEDGRLLAVCEGGAGVVRPVRVLARATLRTARVDAPPEIH